jgi:HSP20 family protein
MADTSRIIEPAVDAPPYETLQEGIRFTPRVDLCENEKELLMFFDIPGTKPESIQLRFDKGVLQLHGNVSQRQRPQGFLLNEYGLGDFHRIMAIETDIEPDNIQADYRLGVLTVRLPRKQASKPRQIAIKAG